MLFEICESVKELACAGDNVAISFIESAAFARINGLHVVFGKPKVLYDISKCDEISKSSRYVFKQLFNDVAREYSGFSNITDRVLVTSRVEKHDEYLVVDPGLATSFISNKSHIIVENVRDYELFIAIQDVVKKRHDISGKCTSIVVHGNGDQVCDSFKRYLGETYPCICVVDSDKKSPHSEISHSSTAGKLLCLDSNNKFVKKYIIPVHEVENLIPYEALVDHKINNNALSKVGIELLTKLWDEGDAYFFADIKSGLCVSKLFKYKSNKPFFSFWINYLEKLKIDMPHVFSEECLCQKCNNCKKNNSCEQIFIPKTGLYSTQTINQSCNYYDSSDSSELFREIWNGLGRVLVNITCAWKPLRLT
jgi:hypothetical protein